MLIMISFKKIFKEYVLPTDGKADPFITINKQTFGLRHSVKLVIEQHEDIRHIVCESDGYIVVCGRKQKSAVISENQVFFVETAAGETLSVCFDLSSPVFPVMQKYILSPSCKIRIGSDRNNDIVYKHMNFVSRSHAEIIFSGGHWTVVDHSRNGVCVNNIAVKNSQRLHFGDNIYICGLKLIYAGTILCVSNLFGNCDISSTMKPYDAVVNRFGRAGSAGNRGYFNRSARNIPIISSGEIDIESPPAAQEPKKKSILEAIGRPLTMSVPMIIGFCMMAIGMSGSGGFMSMGIITAVSSALLGAIWAMFSLKARSEEELDKDRRRFNAYGNYLIAISRELASKYKSNYLALCSMYPSALECAAYNENNPALWNRNFMHSDFLFVRLGLGNIPFQYNIKIPRTQFAVNADVLAECPAELKNEYSELQNVPIGIDLREYKLVGLIGEPSEQLNLAHLIITQLAANICYTDLKIILLNHQSAYYDAQAWNFLRKMPHNWSDDKKTRFFSMNRTEVEDISYELVKVLRKRAAAEGKSTPKPHYVVILTNPAALDNSILSTYLLSPDDKYGVSTLILADSYANLPNECQFCIRSKGKKGYIDDLMNSNRQRIYFRKDEIKLSVLDAMAHRLANIIVDEKVADQSIPTQVDFLSLFGAARMSDLKIESRWKDSSVKDSMSVPVGRKAGGELCFLDLHERSHGPHGLVAGTTGSGKSELLQSLILSLCVNFSPDDVNFFLVDYKGGGMANLFSKLPHVAGMITNLSGNSIRRAMISIKSESLRRQRMFNDCFVRSINQYTGLYKEKMVSVPIPHLIIIVDEFAELKKNEPEFMQELISIAQVGRSLGIHLILATQKPGGTVDDNIRTNSKFRLCLRVQDKQDSMDVLGHPDAAYITQPGGAIFQVGDEIYEPFQSAWSGAIYTDGMEEDNSAVIVGNTGRPSISFGASAIKRAEEKKIAWYAAIVGVFRDLAVADVDICNLDGGAALELCERAVSVLRLKNADFRGNAAELMNITSLFPKDSQEMSDYDIAAEILSTSAEKGVKLPVVEELTQLDAVIDVVKKTVEENEYNSAHMLWLPCLSDRIVLGDISSADRYFSAEEGWKKSGNGFSLSTVIGLADDPANQSQFPLSVDFASGGNHAVIGAVASGKSTFVQTAVYGLVNTYTPEQLNVYIIDFSSRALTVFEKLPHVGGVVCDDDGDRLDKLFWLLNDILRNRKQILKGGTYSDYIKNYSTPLPAVLLVIDNYAGFKSKTDRKFDENILQLSREGISCGIYLLVTGSGFGMTDIDSRQAENIKTVFTLELSDKFKYADALHTTNIDILPEKSIRGRGLARIGNRCLEYQTALMNHCEDAYSSGKEALKLFAVMDSAWHGMRAVPIPYIPSDPQYSQFCMLPEFEQSVKSDNGLPIGYCADTAQVCSINLDETFCFTVAGQTQGCMRNILKLLIRAASKKDDASVYIITGEATPTITYGGAESDEYIRNDEELFAFFKYLTPEFVRRNKRKNELLSKGMGKDDILAAIKAEFDPIFIFIDDISACMQSIYKPENRAKKMSGFFENITEKGAMHRIFLIGAVNLSETVHMNSYTAFKNYVSHGNGLLAEAAPSSQKIFDMSDLAYSASSKKPARRNAYIVSSENYESKTRRIIIPDADR